MKRIKSPNRSFCDLRGSKSMDKLKNRPAFYRHRGNFRWHGIKDKPYKTSGDEWSNIIRRVIIGEKGESTKFHVRYFEIFPGGNSSLEKHRHEHVVICVKGKGIIRYGKTRREMNFMDIAYISPLIEHQLLNPFEEPFGFLCIVNAKRDRPVVIKDRSS